MKSFNHVYTSLEELESFILNHDIATSSNVLVQVFSGLIDEMKLLNMCNSIKNIIPQVHIIGTTSAGEINEGKMLDKSITISFSTFDSTKIKSKLYENISESDCAKDIINDLVEDDTKVLIVFSDGLKSNGEEFIKAITKLQKNLIISGGRAGDNYTFSKTFIFDGITTSENGFVVASLSGKELIANTDYVLNWEKLGIPMVVTKAEKNILYEINNTPIVEIYKKYLGDEVSLSLPEAAVEFPFILKRGLIDVARAPVALLEDNSLLFGGNIEVGEELSFAFGNVEVIQEKNRKKFKDIQSLPIESIFIYSCSVRKYLLGKELESELELFNQVAPTVGYFTYGEFFHSSNKNELLNITSTYLFLSESDKVQKRIVQDTLKTPKKTNSLKVLSHLVSTTSQELIKAQDILNETQSIVEVGSWEIDLETNNIWWSDETYKIFQVEKNTFDVNYESVLSLIYPEDRELVDMAVSMCIESNIDLNVEHRVLLKSNEYKIVKALGKVRRDSQGNAIALIGTTKNITERKNTEKELTTLKDIAISSEQSKSEFLANMSHEIRTPLNAIVGFIDLLESMETESKKLEYLSVVKESSKNLLGIINDILDMSKIASGKLLVESIPLNIKEVVDSVYNLYSVAADNKGIQLQYDFSTEVPKFILGDPLRIKQVLSNLMSNAIKFTNENGLVEFNVDYGESDLIIKVSDNGIGIDTQKLKIIFDSFSQADSSVSRKYGGTGLGLNISKALSKLMGGDLSAVSNYGEGSTFKFTIKAIETKNDTEDVENLESISEEDVKYSGKVLVAEDNKTNQLLISILLDDLGLDYHLVINGKEAVDICKIEEFDLILMDINMPIMNGIEALHAIRNDEDILESMKVVPIMALTANAIKGDKEKFMKEGMNGYVSKPIDIELLISELNKFLPRV
ncbi:ATP-binding protein [Sulfurimonas sp.]|nr:ATP-binding protein [Sulfurimonas sp.]